MSSFWSAWVIGLIIFNLGVALLLFLWAPRVDIPTQPDGTSGHVWAHGVLREGIRQLPMWWVALSAAMFIAAGVYLVLYPGMGSYPGAFGWTSADELRRDRELNGGRQAALLARIHDKPVEAIATDPEAVAQGQLLFVDNCAACHGRAGLGNPVIGAPDLTDHDWLYGGDGKAILASVLDGRKGVMPAFAGTIPDDSIVDVVNYVESLSGLPNDGLRAYFGKRVFATCAACHGANAKGNAALGAPDLTDNVWLYGRNQSDLLATVRHGRSGTMPSWRARLGEDNARLVSAWVYAQSNPVGRAAVK